MRSRVAIIATLIALALLAGLYTFNCALLAREANGEIERDVSFLAEATVRFNVAEDLAEREGFLKTIPVSPRTVKGLYDADGAGIYVSDERYARLGEGDIARASAERVTVFRRKNDAGKPAAYAIYRFDDGAFLLYAKPLETVLTEIAEHPSMIAFGLVFGIAMVLFIFVLLNVMYRERKLLQTMRALDRFADGDFDTRIQGFSEKDTDVAEYNAIINNIQERIFKQKNRNRVLNSVMTQMQNGIIAVDSDLHITLVTTVAKKLLGISGNADGLSVSEASKDVKLDDVFTEAMQREGVYTNEVAARTAIGRGHRPLRLYVSPMQQNGKVQGALAIVEDITELRRLEQVRTDFAANVSHELKTPLTSIRGFVETLQAGAIDNPEMAHKFLNIIVMETDRLSRLINDILSISKLESGRDEVATERIRLDKKAYDICEMLTIQANSKNVTLNYRLNDEPVYIIGNPDRVEQLLVNLTENAIKYNVEGGSVTVQVFESRDEANITISDTGIGIAEENLPRLFERFYRVDKGRSRQMGGTGLGLAIVKHIVRSMNGEIEVHSKLGEGTEFLITLPLAPKKQPDKETIFDDLQTYQQD